MKILLLTHTDVLYTLRMYMYVMWLISVKQFTFDTILLAQGGFLPCAKSFMTN